MIKYPGGSFIGAHIAGMFNMASGHIPVKLYHLKNAKIVWLNKRVVHKDPAFARVNYDCDAYEKFILDECAFATFGSAASSTDFKIGVADRYGGEGIGRNGGSGRAVFLNGYHVKGIGRTPLVSNLTDLNHGSGGAYLEECVREAIFSEIVDAEFPFGAIPVIAIIDTGEYQIWNTKDGPKPERKCLLVRPGFVRPAHFERAVGFITEDPCEGLKDVHRVRQTFISSKCLFGEEVLVTGFKAVWTRWAGQLAYGLVHRLAHGGNTTSNVSFDGKLLDFGATTSVPTWARIGVANGAPPIGVDLPTLMQAVQTQCYFWGENFSPEFSSTAFVNEIIKNVEAAYYHALCLQVLRLIGLSDSESKRMLASSDSERLRPAVNRMIGHFQKEQFSIFYGTPSPRIEWDIDQIWQDGCPEHLCEIRDLIKDLQGGTVECIGLLKNRALARCYSRPSLYREKIKDTIYESLESTSYGLFLDRDYVSKFINLNIVENRRDSKIEPEEAYPLGFALNNDGALALFFCLRNKEIFSLSEWHTNLAGRERRKILRIDSARLVFESSSEEFRGAVKIFDHCSYVCESKENKHLR